jgi:hypothetical protein
MVLAVRLLAVAATALLLSLSGCGGRTGSSQTITGRAGGTRPAPTSVQPRPQVTTGTVGSVLPFDDGTVAGTIMLKRFERIPRGQGGDADLRPGHGSFLVVQFKLAVTRGSVVTSPLAFQAQTADGQVFPGQTGVVEYPLNPRKSLLSAGQAARGDVAFDVPRGTLLISYSPRGTPLVSFTVVG